MRASVGVLGRLVAAAALAATTYVGLPVAPASAATCPSAAGVSVVVDFHELGGGVQTACVPDGGGDTAASLFPAAGFPLTYVQRQPGFVCRVSGKPADDPCVNTPPADAYWGLWWSDGKSGSWTYSSSGAGSLRVPEGGYVAFSWNGSSSRSAPGAGPTPHAAPSPSPSPTHDPAPGPTHGSTTPGPSQAPTHTSGPATGSSSSTSGSPSGSATASASDGPGGTSGRPDRGGHDKARRTGGRASATPDENAGPSPTATASTDELSAASSDPADPGEGGLPSWVAPALIVVLFGGAAGAALVRRRRAGGS